MAPRDWRNPADYADLAALDLASLAWEFLRRNPQYRLDYAGRALGRAEALRRWGLRFALAPDREAQGAPLFWRAEIAPAHVLLLTVSPLGGLTAADLALRAAAAREAEDGLHLRFRDGVQVIVPAGTPSDAPLAGTAALDPGLGVRLTGLGALERGLADRGPGPDPLSPQGRARAVQMLRALDARAAGASYRDVAERVLGRAVEGGGWRTAPARDVAIRLCRAARRLMGGGYLGLLLRRR
jgi:hypothetical protein